TIVVAVVIAVAGLGAVRLTIGLRVARLAGGGRSADACAHRGAEHRAHGAALAAHPAAGDTASGQKADSRTGQAAGDLALALIADTLVVMGLAGFVALAVAVAVLGRIAVALGRGGQGGRTGGDGGDRDGGILQEGVHHSAPSLGVAAPNGSAPPCR